MIKNIKLLIMDVDGTLTDGKIYMGESGEAFKAFNIKDGCGIHDLLPNVNIEWNNKGDSRNLKGIVPIIITARKSKALENRCNELGIIHLYQGCRNKVAKIEQLAREFFLIPETKAGERCYEEIAYIGDDLIDLPAMKICGLVGCPANAAKQVKEISDFISSYNGGDGAVRDFIEWLIGDEDIEFS